MFYIFFHCLRRDCVAEKDSFHPEMIAKIDWYRKGYHVTLALSLISTFILLLSILVIVMLVHRDKPHAVVVAMSPDGKLLRPIQLDHPVFSQAAITNFATEIATGIYTLTFQTWIKDLTAIEPDFFPQTFSGLVSVMKSNLLPSIINQKLFVNASPSSASIIVNEGVIQMGPGAGSYGWIVDTPLVVSFSSGGGSDRGTTQHLVVRETVIQANPLTYAKGLAVVDIQIRSGGGN